MAEYVYDRIFAPPEAVRAVAETDDTPFYLYDKKGILDSIRGIHNAYSRINGYQNYFAIRENNNPYILKLLAQAGTGVCACSYTELLLAEQCGFNGSQLLYEPTRRDVKAEALAMQLNVTWLLNGIGLLPEGLPNRIILRYHPSEERLNAVQFPTIGKSKNGISRQKIFDVLSDLHDRGVEQLGLALQVASYSIKRGVWAKKAGIILSLAQEVRKKLGFSLWAIHIGEGPGLPYQSRASAPTVLEEAEAVNELLSVLPEETKPVLFTGVNRQLMEQNGILITKILEQRNLYNTYLILDSGIGHYPRSVLKQAYRHVSVLGNSRTENRKIYHLVGEMPDEFDHPVRKGRMLPEVKPGDYCVLHDVGCGGRSMAMLYGCPMIAAEYIYEEDGTIRKISPGRTSQEVLEFLTAW